MDECKFLEAVEQYREEFDKTTRDFESRGQALASRAKYTSLSLKDLDKARQMIREGVDLTTDYFIACEAIIFALDALAQPLLGKGLTARGVGAVADLMQEITSDMDSSSTTFSVSWEGVDLGQAGVVQPKPGALAKSKQMYWKQQYRSMPDYETEVQRRKQEALEKQQREKQAQREHEQKLDELEREDKAYREANRSVEERRQALRDRCEDAVAAFERQAEEALDRCSRQLPQWAKELAETLKNEKKDLALDRKYCNPNSRPHLDEKIRVVDAAAALVVTEDYQRAYQQSCRKQIYEAAQQYRQELEQYAQQCFAPDVDVEKVQIPQAPREDYAPLTDEQEEILAAVERYGWQTIMEIQEKLRGTQPNQRVAANLKQIAAKGRVMRVEAGHRAYFGCPWQPFRPKVNWTVNETMLKQKLPKAKPMEFTKEAFMAWDKDFALAKKQLGRKRSSGKSKRTAIIAVVAVVAALIGYLAYGGYVHAQTSKQQRLQLAYAIAQDHLDQAVQEAQEMYWMEDYGVTALSGTVEEIVFISAKDIVYGNSDDHYQAKVRIDCTATNPDKVGGTTLSKCIVRCMPAVLGQVEDYWIRLWAELGIENDVQLLGGDYDGKYMVFVYVNGEFVQGPIY